MRMKASRGRGRPRGRYPSVADYKLLQYLALLSTNYEIDSDEFFGGCVEAWKHHESTRKSLSIKCRKKTRNDAMFLITNDFKVVAQFPIPTHILEKSNPLKEFVT
jgi:hypothetical protein